jgi:opacity protein-like surface antigen
LKKQLTGIGLALLLFSAAAHAQDTQDATKLIGSWRLIKAIYGGKPLNFNGAVKIKNVTDSQFMWFAHKEGSRIVTDLGGGPYSVKGDTYTERLDYGLGADFKVVQGHAIPLKWKLDGNTWHITGTLNNGLLIEEDWQKLQPQQVGP